MNASVSRNSCSVSPGKPVRISVVKAADGKQTVAQYIAQVAKANGADLSIKSFVRFETGEGIEKKQDNFAEEVMAQAGLK